MTTRQDNYEGRIGRLGKGLEDTQGVSQDGMQDLTGEYPKREYNYGSSVNKAARGTKVNELHIGGGDVGLSLDIADQRPSEYPLNQVQETASGHVVEYDDTPGGERILIRHRKGAGIEMRADGSVIVSSRNNRIEVTGGDHTAIVEGHGNLVYKGNLNLVVTGDWNVDVGGDWNMHVHGNRRTLVDNSSRNIVLGNSSHDVRKNSSTITGGREFGMVYGKSVKYVKGDAKHWIEGSNEVAVEKDMFTSAKNSHVVVSKTSSLTGHDFVSVLGNDGTVGGKKVDFTGQAFMGHAGPEPFTSGAAFYGSFHGQATEALFSRFATKAQKSKFAEEADLANSQSYPQDATSGSPHGQKGGAPDTVHNQETHGPDGPPPIPTLIASYVNSGPFAIRSVVIDHGDASKNAREKVDDYAGIFTKTPTVQEIRSAFRDPANIEGIGGKLVADGLLNPDYRRKTPPAIGRTASEEPTPKFGFNPIGNSVENQGKRFIPKRGRR